MHDSLFQKSRAAEFDRMRRLAKLKSACITYDCYNAVYPRKGSRVRCRLGHSLSNKKDGAMDLAAVLAGKTGTGCPFCEDFSGGD